jgi:putative ATP-dependent endonuclease of OLD family
VASKKAKSSGVRIVCARVSNFRSLQNMEIDLDALTVLVGANNSGKTSVLDAIQAAIGATRKILTKDDVFLDNGEVDVPKSRKAVIDILLKPTNDDGEPIENFPAGSFWTGLWGEGIVQAPPDYSADQVAIRTTLAWSDAHADYRTTRNFLQEWKRFEDWLTSAELDSVSVADIEPIAMYYIDAKRDLEEDLRSKGSFFRRLTDDLGLSDKDVQAIEKTLTDLNRDMISKSDVLKHLGEMLVKLQDVIASGQTTVDIAPIPRRLRDLSRGIDVTLSTSGAQTFPLNRHGMGTRSLASLLVFRAFASWREEKAVAADDKIHTFLALEEPEAHLHPQAQRALFAQVRAIPGQRIVSTHSPYFAGQASLESLRLLTKKEKATVVSKLNLSNIDPDDRRKLEREVIASKGDLLFARAIILFEGETEEQALPILSQARFGMSAHELGFNFVGVGGGNYFPFLWLAKSFEIPWYIFSDGEPEPLKGLGKQLARAGEPKVEACSNVFVIPKGNDYEKQLLDEGYGDAVEAAISGLYGAKELDGYIAKLHGTPLRKVGGTQFLRNYAGKDGRRNAQLDFMRGNKTSVAAPIAEAIAGLSAARQTPKCLVNLFNKLASDFSLK